MMDNIKNWFLQLQKREQYSVGAGAVVAIILLLYGLIWSPLSAMVERSKLAIQTNQQLLQFMQHVQPKILALRSQQPKKITTINDIMLEVEHALAMADLAKYLKNVQQPTTDSVTIQLQAVPFDAIISWLQQFVSSYSVKVIEFQAKSNGIFGTVDVQFTLQKF